MVLLRAAIVVHKTLEPAAVANAAAILMGQLAHLEPELFEVKGVADAAGEAGVPNAVFSTAGRGLSNTFDAYAELVGGAGTEELGVIAVGPDETVRALTESFSSFK